MITFRSQELESLGFEWDSHSTAWEDRLSELADYHKIHGECNVSQDYSENTLLGYWVRTQRSNYRLQQSITSGRDPGVHASGVSLLYLVFVVSFLPLYGLKVCSITRSLTHLKTFSNFS
jgi:hypothetical protein